MKKNFYELTEDELEKYDEEWSKTPYFKLTIRNTAIAGAIFFILAIFLLIVSFIEQDDFTQIIAVVASLLIIVGGSIGCIKSLMNLEKDFQRWLKVKHDIDY